MVESRDISQSSEGSGPIDRLAAEFGITTDEANAAVDALVPGIAAAVEARATKPAGFLSFLGVPGAGQPLAALGDPTALPISDAERDALVARAAATSGLAPDLLRKMLPVLGSLAVTAIVNLIQSRGLGGLGTILEQVIRGGRGQASPVPPQGAPSGPGGIDLGAILEQLIKGVRGQPSPPSAGTPEHASSGLEDEIGKILRGGQG
jgi:hypothetical protein